jgi:hypothetical protein
MRRVVHSGRRPLAGCLLVVGVGIGVGIGVVVGASGCGGRSGLLGPTAAGEDGGGRAVPPAGALPAQAGATGGCPDAGSTPIFVVTQQSAFMSFDPAMGTFTRIGWLACPASLNADATPFSMAVANAGVAYVVYTDGELFRVGTADASCQKTGLSPLGASQQRAGVGPTFGMGYSRDSPDGDGVLYVAGDEGQGPRLASLDIATLSFQLVGAFDPSIGRPDLAGNGSGDLFAFYGTDAGSAIAQADRSTARLTGSSALPGVFRGGGSAFAVWGGDFYTFTAPNVRSVVTRLRPRDGSVAQVAELDDVIVGAGVSTCAP